MITCCIDLYCFDNKYYLKLRKGVALLRLLLILAGLLLIPEMAMAEEFKNLGINRNGAGYLYRFDFSGCLRFCHGRGIYPFT